MAKKKNNQAKKNQKQNSNIKSKVVQNKKVAANPVKATREPSKNEIMFFRIGIAVVALGLVVAAIVMIVSSFMNKEDVNPYEDYNHLTTEEFVAMTKYVNDTTYGDLDYFQGKTEYEDLRVILDQNVVFHFYFYRSSVINEDIQVEIDKLENIIDSSLLFIDLDGFGNSTLLEDENLAHLNLPTDVDNMLLVYNMQPDDISEFFNLETKVSDIIDILIENL